jgi:hypothetical protein
MAIKNTFFIVKFLTCSRKFRLNFENIAPESLGLGRVHGQISGIGLAFSATKVPKTGFHCPQGFMFK